MFDVIKVTKKTKTIKKKIINKSWIRYCSLTDLKYNKRVNGV